MTVVCKTCKETFPDAVTRKNHVRSVHQKSLKWRSTHEIAKINGHFHCMFCSKKYTNARSIRDHMDKKHGATQNEPVEENIFDLCFKSPTEPQYPKYVIYLGWNQKFDLEDIKTKAAHADIFPTADSLYCIPGHVLTYFEEIQKTISICTDAVRRGVMRDGSGSFFKGLSKPASLKKYAR